MQVFALIYLFLRNDKLLNTQSMFERIEINKIEENFKKRQKVNQQFVNK